MMREFVGLKEHSTNLVLHFYKVGETVRLKMVKSEAAEAKATFSH